MSVPRWTVALLGRVVPADRVEDLVGDLEEAHRGRVRRRGQVLATVLTTAEALELAFALLRERRRERGAAAASSDRAARGFGVSWLDFKLGFRMLVKYPGLTLVGGFAMAFAIWVGAGTFEFVSQLAFPRLGLEDGDRIVGLRVWDASAGRPEPRVLDDFGTWREELESVRDLGAYRTLNRNLVVDEGRGEPIEVAEMSASGFRVARVPPLLGRTLVDADERSGAPAVIVLGYDVWRARFAGDSGVVGRTVRLDATARTVVGVMPDGFGFPVHHDAWTPLAADAMAQGRRAGPAVQMFGRLAPGESLESARAELTALGRRAAVDYPATHEHLRPEVMPYAESVLGSLITGNIPSWFSWGFMSSNLLLVMLLALICANVALLMFARAATRESEIVVRTALGASRRRIVTQLFVEALVLGGAAAIVALAAAGAGLRWGIGIFEAEFGELPFWITDTLSPATVFYAGLLTVLGAVIAGVLPARRITRQLGVQLKQASPGGGGLRFGGIWTAVIIAQVAVTVTFPAVAFFLNHGTQNLRGYDLGFPEHAYIGARLELDAGSPAVSDDDVARATFLEHYASTIDELERRLSAEPAVAGITFTERLPRTYHQWNQIEVLEGALPPRDARGHRVGSVFVELDYFDVLGTPLIAGRPFHSGDLLPGARTVIVNQPFVDSILGGRNPIGRHIRYVANEDARNWDPGPWHEIIGVAPDLGMQSGYGRFGIYHPAAHGDILPAWITLHVPGDPDGFMPRLRTIAADIDPTLRLHEMMTLDHVLDAEMRFLSFWFRLVLVVSTLALLLSLCGIYAVMAFTVTRRTREIGIRVALGAEPRRIALAIFRRPLRHLAIGIVLGGMLTTGLSFSVMGKGIWPDGILAVAAYAIVMLGVCLLACIVPTRRALGVEPTQAMRMEG